MNVLVVRRAATLAIAALLGAGLVPLAHASDSQAIGWILTRVGNSARPIEGTLEASAVSNESAVVMFATLGSKEHRHIDYRFTTTTAEWGGDAWVRLNGSGAPSVPCAAACQSPVGFRRTVYVTSNGRALSSTVYVAAFDMQDPTLTITSPGWSIRKWRPHWQELSTSDASGSTSVTAMHESAGTYRGGQLAGGRYGSLVSAFVPCDLGGSGSVSLSGGTRVWPMSCDRASSVVDASPGRTTWRVTGEITGAGSATGVLIVVDFPR
ncbi:MAG: hypothetical protein QOC82_2815 [Frankiaceae bacterium]|jgi:hypothetical protein|nr:hypothetical protein [Frankiaceae bacterium]